MPPCCWMATTFIIVLMNRSLLDYSLYPATSFALPTSDALAARLAPHLSREQTKSLFQALVRVPSPQTDLLEEEPQLRAFIKEALLKKVETLGCFARLDALGNLIAESGTGRSGRSLMLVSHAMNQPPSTMA